MHYIIWDKRYMYIYIRSIIGNGCSINENLNESYLRLLSREENVTLMNLLMKDLCARLRAFRLIASHYVKTN